MPVRATQVGEVAACLIRVPTGVVTQRMQVGQYSSFVEAVRGIAAQPGGLSTFYLGFWTTVAREIPFSFIQFPMYEGLKKTWACRQGSETTPMQGAICGSLSGSLAAALTCPLDVVKTRMMLGSKSASGQLYQGTLSSLRTVAVEEGPSALLKGMGPRVGWISVGGSVARRFARACTSTEQAESHRRHGCRASQDHCPYLDGRVCPPPRRIFFFGAYEKASDLLWKSGAWGRRYA